MNLKKFIKQYRNFLFLILITCVVFFVRLFYQARYFEDWDSIQFALGLHNYSIVNHQPHPPGYPLYILFGKFLYFFFQNDLKALNFISLFLGTLSTIPLYLLAKKLFNQTTAYIAVLLFIVTPITWLLSEMPLTDTPGLFFLLTTLYLLLVTKDTPQKFIPACFFSGLILGFRTNSFLIPIGIICLILFKKHQLKLALLSLFSFMCGIAAWLIPIIILTGTDQFAKSYFSISSYVIEHDVLQGSRLGIKNLVRVKIGQFWYLLEIGFTKWLSIISLFTLVYVFIKKRRWSELNYQFLGVWLIAHLIPQFTFYNLEMPRHTLPLLPPILIIVSSVLSRLVKKNLFAVGFVFVLLTLLFLQSFSQVSRFKYQIPPTIKPIQFVRQNFEPKNTVIIAGLTYRQFQYYAPDYTTYYGDKISIIDIPKDKTIIVDYLPLKDHIKGSENLKLIKEVSFTGEKDIFPRVPKTSLYILRWID